MNLYEREIKEWENEIYNLANVGYDLADAGGDNQKEKLSLYVTKEILTQCKEIQEIAWELSKDMMKLKEYIEDEMTEIQKVKRYMR